MKPAPSSERLLSKCTQSTILESSSLIIFPVCPLELRLTGERVKLALASIVEWIFRRAEGQPQRHRLDLQVPPHRVQQVAAVAVGQLVDARAEHHERGRPGLHLRD